MPELKKAQGHVARAVQYLAPANPHPVRDDVRMHLPTLRDRLEHLSVDLGLLIELQNEGAEGGPDAEP